MNFEMLRPRSNLKQTGFQAERSDKERVQIFPYKFSNMLVHIAFKILYCKYYIILKATDGSQILMVDGF